MALQCFPHRILMLAENWELDVEQIFISSLIFPLSFSSSALISYFYVFYVICNSIHPSVPIYMLCHVSGSSLWGQQSKQRCPVFPSSGHLLQFFCRETEKAPRQAKRYNPSKCPGSIPATSQYDLPETPKQASYSDACSGIWLRYFQGEGIQTWRRKMA